MKRKRQLELVPSEPMEIPVNTEIPWWEDLGSHEDRDQDFAKAERLVNVLSKLDGSKEDKLQFVMENMALIEAEAAKDGFDPEQNRKAWNAKVVSVTFRFWRTELNKQDQQFRKPITMSFNDKIQASLRGDFGGKRKP